MLISHSHKFIFIHIYKIAGTSIAESLSRYTNTSLDNHSKIIRFLRSLGVHRLIPANKINKIRNARHATALDISNSLTPEIFDNYYKFAFVRNPWDWQVSLYHFALEDTSHHQHQLTKSFGNFEKYIEWRVDGNFILQKEFLTNKNGEMIVDFVGRFEQLSDDFEKVCNHLEIENSMLPHRRSSSHKDYRTYYSDKTAGLVENAFKEDIEYFSYEFKP